VKDISVIIITNNEEKNIRKVLKSVCWADEIIVVDSESRDKTREIASELGAEVFVRKWTGFADQKKYALSLAKNEWVLSIDADEEITEALKKEIEELDENKADGFYIRRENYYLDKHITSCGWNNDYQLRLFRKAKTEMNFRLVHEGFLVNGITAKLHSTMKHYTFTSIAPELSKINTYSTLEARERMKKKKIVKGKNIFLHALAAFLRDFISQKGYKDGVYGLVISFLSGVTTLLTYTKIWEMQNTGYENANL
jgi:(heptosyl)LPS beta-1,4-glucosyltransferase